MISQTTTNKQTNKQQSGIYGKHRNLITEQFTWNVFTFTKEWSIVVHRDPKCSHFHYITQLCFLCHDWLMVSCLNYCTEINLKYLPGLFFSQPFSVQYTTSTQQKNNQNWIIYCRTPWLIHGRGWGGGVCSTWGNYRVQTEY